MKNALENSGKVNLSLFRSRLKNAHIWHFWDLAWIGREDHHGQQQMPRNKARFSKLNQQLRDLGGVPAPDGKLGRYYLYRIGQRKLRQGNKTPAGSRVRRQTSVLPFAITEPATTPTGANYIVVSVSEYSLSGLQTRLTTLSRTADLGWAAVTTGNTPLSSLFYPALAIIRCSRSGATAIDRISDITGVSYKYSANRSFGIPFGRILGTPNNDYTTQRNAIAAKVLAITGVRGVSFQNEVLRAAAQLKSTEELPPTHSVS